LAFVISELQEFADKPYLRFEPEEEKNLTQSHFVRFCEYRGMIALAVTITVNYDLANLFF